MACETNTGPPLHGNTDPIHIGGFGNSYQRERVLSLPGPERFEFSLHYNHLDSESQYWRSGYSRLLTTTLTGPAATQYPITPPFAHVIARRDHGKALHFSSQIDPQTLHSIDDEWPGPGSSSARLFSRYDGNDDLIGFELLPGDGSREIYDLEGTLQTIVSSDGHELTFAHDANGQLDTITNDFGATLLTFTWLNGRVSEVQDVSGERYQFEYDSQGLLEYLIFPDHPPVKTPSDDTDNPRRTYHYEDTNNPSRLTGITDERGKRVVSWSYDNKGRGTLSVRGDDTSTVDRYEVTYNTNGTSSVTDPLGRERTYSFVTEHGLIKLDTVAGGACNQCGSDMAHVDYDANGFLEKKTDFKNNVTDYVYNNRGLQESRTEAAGTTQARTITTTWHPTFRKPETITQPHRTTVHTYNTRGQIETRTVTDTQSVPNVSRTTTYHYDSAGRLDGIDGPRTDMSDITSFTYHPGTSNRATMTNALGQVTQYTDYDGAGRLERLVDLNGLVTTFTYYPRGWLKTRTVGEGAEAVTTTFTYDAAGHLDRLTLPTGGYVDYDYEDAGRLEEITDSDGNTIKYTLDAMGNREREDTQNSAGVLKRTVRRLYDDLNRLDQVFYPVEGIEQALDYGYDANGNRTSERNARHYTTTWNHDPLDRLKEQIDPEAGLVEYAYDAQDNLTEVTDANGNTTIYNYNGFGEKILQDSPDTGITTYTYDEAGNLKTQTDARGVTTTYAYDALNRLTQVAYPSNAHRVDYEYDRGVNGIGRLYRMIDRTGMTEYVYDTRGNVVEQREARGGYPALIGYEYDDNDRITALRYPSGYRVLYDRDPLGAVTKVTLDAPGGPYILAENLQYLPFGPLERLDYGNGLELVRTFDQGYRLTNQLIDDTTAVLDRTREYDPVGNIKKLLDHGVTVRHQDFDYDALDRLDLADGPYGLIDYDYEANGNREAFSDLLGLTTYNYYPGTNRLQTLSGAKTATYTYDAVGNPLSDGTAAFTYDEPNRLATYSAPGVSANYRYDGRGRRTRKKVGSEFTYFHYDLRGHLIGEYGKETEPFHEYIYLDEEPIAIIHPGELTQPGIVLRPIVGYGARRQAGLGNHSEAPVVIAGPPTTLGEGDVAVSLKNVTTSKVGVAVKEWEYQDGVHDLEQVALLAVPPGRYAQADGSVWEFGRFDLSGTGTPTAVSFTAAFSAPPRLFLSAQSANDGQLFTVRASNVTAAGFEALLYEQEAYQDGHPSETVGYLAVSSPIGSGTATLGGVDLDYRLTQIHLGTDWMNVFDQALKLEEEKSLDSESTHTLEQVDVLQLADYIFAQDVSAIEADTAAIRRIGPTPAATYPQARVVDYIYYAHADHLGAIAKVTDQSQTVVWDADRRPFGELEILTEQVTMPLRFPGQYFDAESGLYYNYFRDYDPATGRYIQSDPIGLEGGLNTYSYVGGNPLSYSDPYGLNPAGIARVIQALSSLSRARPIRPIPPLVPPGPLPNHPGTDIPVDVPLPWWNEGGNVIPGTFPQRCHLLRQYENDLGSTICEYRCPGSSDPVELPPEKNCDGTYYCPRTVDL